MQPFENFRRTELVKRFGIEMYQPIVFVEHNGILEHVQVANNIPAGNVWLHVVVLSRPDDEANIVSIRRPGIANKMCDEPVDIV